MDSYVSTFFTKHMTQLFDLFLGAITNSIIVVIAALIVPTFFLFRKNKKSLWPLWLSFMTTTIAVFLIKLIVHRQRPSGLVMYTFTGMTDYSFPSMHSAVVFSIIPVVNKYVPKYKHFWILFAFLVALSRLYFNVHYLSDVIIGAILGFLVGTLFLRLLANEKNK